MRIPLALLALSLVALPAADAAAQSPGAPSAKPAGAAKPKPKGGAEPKVDLPAGTLDKLKSGDPAQVQGALDDIRMAGKGAQGAAPAVADALQKGLTLKLTIAALETLGDVEATSATDTVAWYTVHRNPAVRQAAVKALIHTKGPGAVKALRRALSDGDAMVRGMAATGLGTLKARESVADLFVALDHRVGEAAASIGQLCTPAECEQLTGKLGKVPFDVVTGGLDQVLFRPIAEVSDDDKVKIVGRVRELGTPEANKFLRDVQKRWPAAWSPRVKQAIDQGVLATGGGAQGGTE
jgi:hypothetical protein